MEKQDNSVHKDPPIPQMRNDPIPKGPNTPAPNIEKNDRKSRPKQKVQTKEKPHSPKRLPIELAPLNTNPIFRNRHTQILHRENSPTLPRPSRPPTTKSRPLNPKMCRLTALLAAGRWRRASGRIEARCSSQTADGVIGRGTV